MNFHAVFFSFFLSSADFFQKLAFFSKKYFRNIIRVSNGLDPDQDRQLVLVWDQIVCKRYQQMSKVAASRERDNTCDGLVKVINLRIPF